MGTLTMVTWLDIPWGHLTKLDDQAEISEFKVFLTKMSHFCFYFVLKGNTAFPSKAVNDVVDSTQSRVDSDS